MKKKVQVLLFWDEKAISHEDNSVETDVYCKPTNTLDYLQYDSVHPNHTKNNVACNVNKILVFVSNPEKAIICLDVSKQCLIDCKYPEHIISKCIFNAKPREEQGTTTN